MNAFGNFLRQRREVKRTKDPSFSLRQLAGTIGVEPSYLSKVERGKEPPPSEARIVALAKALGEDPDLLLALAGKVSTDLLEIIRKRPELFSHLLRELKSLPDHAVLRIARDVRDGKW